MFGFTSQSKKCEECQVILSRSYFLYYSDRSTVAPICVNCFSKK